MIIDYFSGEYGFLSNFSYSPITIEGKTWPTIEHMFQAGKTLDENMRERIRISPSPKEAKRIGRRMPLRPDWERIKKDVMLECVRLKFGQNRGIREKLFGTGDAVLIEGNTWHDNIWGNCRCSRCREIKGQNLLGRILMKVREELQTFDKMGIS